MGKRTSNVKEEDGAFFGGGGELKTEEKIEARENLGKMSGKR